MQNEAPCIWTGFVPAVKNLSRGSNMKLAAEGEV